MFELENGNKDDDLPTSSQGALSGDENHQIGKLYISVTVKSDLDVCVTGAINDMCVERWTDAATQSNPWHDSSHHRVYQDTLCGERLVFDLNDAKDLGANCDQSQSISAVDINNACLTRRGAAEVAL